MAVTAELVVIWQAAQSICQDASMALGPLHA